LRHDQLAKINQALVASTSKGPFLRLGIFILR
jgi:hypothetical protein